MPLPTRSTRLTFRPGDDAAFLDVFAEVAQGSLDLLTRRNVAAMGTVAQAADELEFYCSLPGERHLWRLAYDRRGRRVGFIIPSRSAYDAGVSYLGVVPQHRGQGYVHDLLAESHAASLMLTLELRGCTGFWSTSPVLHCGDRSDDSRRCSPSLAYMLPTGGRRPDASSFATSPPKRED